MKAALLFAVGLLAGAAPAVLSVNSRALESGGVLLCMAKTCGGLTCGTSTASNDCGGTIGYCGACSTAFPYGNRYCFVFSEGAGTCACDPDTCASRGYDCGAGYTDNCGGGLSCGTCDTGAGYTCSDPLGGTCSCTAPGPTCAADCVGIECTHTAVSHLCNPITLYCDNICSCG